MNTTPAKPKTESKIQPQYFFYICGLTGGPYFPIPAIIQQINKSFPDASNILIGVKNSYEQKLAQSQNLNIEYLPKVKLDLLSFKNAKFLEIIVDLFKLILNVFVFVFSLLKCFILILRYRPVMIYSTGSFLAVPMVWVAVFCNIIKLSNTKIVIHQQDATPGLANILTAKLANLLSCTFDFTQSKYTIFNNATLIPNPIIGYKYNKNNTWIDKNLESFIKKPSNKPQLLIFGGGTGALAINHWVWDNIDELLIKFRIIHLTGSLQSESERQINHLDYHTSQAIFDDMPTLMASVDVVICRAGLGSISELAFLNKLTFLVPIPSTHQVQNAELTSASYNNFRILDQNKTDNWLDQIDNCNTKSLSKVQIFDQAGLDLYYQKLIELTKLDQK
jgi:UDP-N-acetylglucosamine--N-acetylmuramyl-(pentapeptide) pyrophosphoryl-undecaprenol N-acetylglucosamine transferase